MHAARTGRTDLVEILLKAGADVDARDKEGRTAAQIATEAGRNEVAQFLKQSDRK